MINHLISQCRSFKRAVALFATLGLASLGLHADDKRLPGSFTPYAVEMQATGVVIEVAQIKRIIQNRLLVGVFIHGTSRTPPGGVWLGISVHAPPGTKKDDLWRYRPIPYTLTASKMTDELTGKDYPTLPAIAPAGRVYPPDSIIGAAQPSRGQMASIQFECPPPPPPPAPGQPPVKQTLSFLFPKALGPIIHVPVPPLLAADATPQP